MFNKKSRINPNTTDTLIGEGSTFEGKIRSQAGIRLEGEVTGDVICEGDVIIGEKGIARSNVTARNVVLAGQVHGNITAKGKLTIKATGRLSGNLSVAELSIESGGFFAGQSKMEDKQAPRGAADARPENQPKEEAAAGNGTHPNQNDNNGNLLKAW